MLAGLLGGYLGGLAAKKVCDLLHEDDAVIIGRLFQAVLHNLATDYMLTSQELDLVVFVLNQHIQEVQSFFEHLLKSSQQEQDIIIWLTPLFDDIVRQREAIVVNEEDALDDFLAVLFLEDPQV